MPWCSGSTCWLCEARIPASPKHGARRALELTAFGLAGLALGLSISSLIGALIDYRYCLPTTLFEGRGPCMVLGADLSGTGLLVVILTIKAPVYPVMGLLGLAGLALAGRQGGLAAKVFLGTAVAGAILGPLHAGSLLSLLVALFTGGTTYAALWAVGYIVSKTQHGHQE